MQRATQRSREGAPTAHRSNARRRVPPFYGCLEFSTPPCSSFAPQPTPPNRALSVRSKSTHPAEIATSQITENKRERPSYPDTPRQDKRTENLFGNRVAHDPFCLNIQHPASNFRSSMRLPTRQDVSIETPRNIMKTKKSGTPHPAEQIGVASRETSG
jgi:hypothetical protein